MTARAGVNRPEVGSTPTRTPEHRGRGFAWHSSSSPLGTAAVEGVDDDVLVEVVLDAGDGVLGRVRAGEAAARRCRSRRTPRRRRGLRLGELESRSWGPSPPATSSGVDAVVVEEVDADGVDGLLGDALGLLLGGARPSSAAESSGDQGVDVGLGVSSLPPSSEQAAAPPATRRKDRARERPRHGGDGTGATVRGPVRRLGQYSWRSTSWSSARWRLTAETTARSDAVRMLSCRPTPHLTVPSVARGLDVGDGGGVGAGADGVLAVVDDVDVDAEVGLQGGDERGDRAVALAGDGARARRRRGAGRSPSRRARRS